MTDEPLVLRRAEKSDSAVLWAWRNDPLTRSVSLTKDPVPREVHKRWFSTVLRDARRVIYVAVAEDGVARFGMCRFDINEGGRSAVVSINVAPDQRGRGVGAAVLRSALAVFGEESPMIDHVDAHVRKVNVPSMKLFTALGFVCQTTTDDVQVLTYEMPR
jgi:ribosomal protein S18 acetylase RimI-like enzyme